jgi:hypothetical protein
MATVEEVASWMKTELEKHGLLYQDETVVQIQNRYEEDWKEFVYENNNGNWAISRKVLSVFRELTEDSAVWDRGQRMWRVREHYDIPGKRQTE